MNTKLLEIQNNGQELVATNFWNSEIAKHGRFYLSFNAGALRVLLPDSTSHWLSEMRTAKTVDLCRYESIAGPVYDVIFDDGSSRPFSITTTVNGSDRLLPRSEHNKRITISVWTKGADGMPSCRLRLRGRFLAK